jgi:hypothetical protein
MRRLLLGVLLVPLFVRPVVDPYKGAPEPVPPAGFLRADYERTIPTTAASTLLVPVDPGGEAFRLSDAEHGVRFDANGDGVSEMVSWPEPDANVAFLARDTNGDGRITSGKELLGSATYADVHNGCNALMTMFKRSGAELAGSVHDGQELYDQLVLWSDRNRNGRTDRGELTPVRELFTAIGMGFEQVRWSDSHGNVVRFRGWMEARTAGPGQTWAIDQQDEIARRRRYFEVALLTRLP